MVDGQMAEARKGFAFLEEVDEGTSEIFMEWACKGYYEAAYFEMEATSPPSPAPSNEEGCKTTEWIEEPLVEDPFASMNHMDCHLYPIYKSRSSATPGSPALELSASKRSSIRTKLSTSPLP